MNKSLWSELKNCLLKYKDKIKYQRILVLLAFGVVLGTTYVLMEPAITMEEVLICKDEEHTHTSDCYTESFVCEETDENKENEECYVKELTCDKTVHTHDESCYVTASDNEKIIYLVGIIDGLPTVQELNDQVSKLSSEGATDEEIGEYREEVIATASKAYSYYVELEEKVQKQITNIDKLLLYKEADLIEEPESTASVALFDSYDTYAVSTASVDNDTPTKVKSVSTSEFIELNLYDYIKNDDTGESINTNYKSNNKYPGFQWNGGAYLGGTYDRHQVDYIDFGNSMITDLSYGSSSGSTNGKSKNAVVVGNSKGTNGAINKLDVSSYGVTNRPIGMSLNETITDTSEDVLARILGSDGYPALAVDNTSLAYLFQDGNYVTKKNTTSIDGLFQQDETTGKYYYNSRLNHAQYSSSTNKFTLYNQIITPNFIVYPFGNFLPFNTITSTSKATQVSKISSVGDYVTQMIESVGTSNGTRKQLSAMLQMYYDDLAKVSTTGGTAVTTWSAKDAIVDYFTTSDSAANNPSDDTSLITDELLEKMYNIDWNVKTNFFFGMEMKMNFMQPKGGMTGSNSDQPMEFYFTGDDDVWVYIDEVLFLDLSGIHRHVGGKIDFVNGRVEYYYLDTENTGDVSTKPYKTYTFAEILGAAGKGTNNLNSNGTFKDYTTHSFKFYYMERGSGSSVCRIEFNFPLIRQNSITVTKELDLNDASLLGNPDFSFQILKAEGKTKTDELFITKGTTYDILDSTGNKVGEGTVLDDGVFKLKAGQTAVFDGIDENLGDYYVREILDPEWVSQYADVTVDGESTTVNNNAVVGSDTFTGYESGIKDISDGHTSFIYTNKVTANKSGSLEITKKLNSYQTTNLTKEFTFYVTLDGEALPIGTEYVVDGTETKQVLESGIVVIKADETARITEILAGSFFEIKEIVTSMSGYQVGYQVNGVDVTGSSATGYVSNTSIGITVTNTENGSELLIPVTKTIENPNGDNHSYEFELVEVTDSTGNTLVKNGVSKVASIEVKDTGQSSFKIKYSQSDYEDYETKVHYYKIVEVVDDEDISTCYDERVYVIEVTITNTGETFTSNVTGIWIDGEKSSSQIIEFINQLLTELTLSKEVQNIDSGETEFEFQIEILYKGEPIVGKYETSNKAITFDEEGKATVKLKDKESLTIYGLPYNATYKITELTANGFMVEYEVTLDDIKIGSEVTNSLVDETNKVKFINISSYILPDTGSSGMLVLVIIGILLTIGMPVIHIGYMLYSGYKKM